MQTIELSPELEALGATRSPSYWRLRYRYELPTTPSSDAQWMPVELEPSWFSDVCPESIKTLELWLGADGEVILLSWLWWDKIESIQALPLRSAEETRLLSGASRVMTEEPLAGHVKHSWPVGESIFITVCDPELHRDSRDLASVLPPLRYRANEEVESLSKQQAGGVRLFPSYGPLSATPFAPLAQVIVLEGEPQEGLVLVETGLSPPRPSQRIPLDPYWLVPAGRPITISVQVTGGTPPYLYEWRLEPAQGSQVTLEPQVFWTLQPGSYTLYLTVQDARGFVDTPVISIQAVVEERVLEPFSPSPPPAGPPPSSSQASLWMWVALAAVAVAAAAVWLIWKMSTSL
uniref:PKD domain-containing protein n=1 Tax=Acetithermum autotrophicum TaxID=1446466 RepID=H5SQB7_ACEAU|nr:hypothetical protein HGMM_OP1C048 [Candidatus Acetothermum autotrophicum]